MNDGADSLASKAVEEASPPAEICKKMHARAAHALRWQRCMLDIVELRAVTPPLPHRRAGWSAADLKACGVPVDEEEIDVSSLS